MTYKHFIPAADLATASFESRRYMRVLDLHPAWNYDEQGEEFRHRQKPARIALQGDQDITAHLTVEKYCGAQPLEISKAVSSMARVADSLLKKGLAGKFMIEESFMEPRVYSAAIDYAVPLCEITDMERLLHTIEKADIGRWK